MTDKGQETADPSLMSPDNLNLNAKEAIEIRVRMKANDGKEPIGKPAIYFITDEEPSYSGSKMVAALYRAGDDGYAEIVLTEDAEVRSGVLEDLLLDLKADAE